MENFHFSVPAVGKIPATCRSRASLVQTAGKCWCSISTSVNGCSGFSVVPRALPEAPKCLFD